jgi:succinyl-diaminopimelate desuccinylase
MDKLKDFSFTGEEKELLSLTRELLCCETVNPPGIELEAAKIIAQKLELYGIEVEIQKLGEDRANVIGVIKGSGEKPSLLLNGHLDTVPPGQLTWDYPPFSGTVVDGKIYGRGASDMKSGLAALVMAACLIKKSGIKLKGDLIVAGTAGEETDSLGAKAFMDAGYFSNVGQIIIAEPSNLKLFTCQKGALWLEFTTFGKTAHGAMPDLGENAILLMNRFLNRLQDYKFIYNNHPLLTPPTFNVGTVSGGVKNNVVPDRCVLTIDIRTVPGQSHEAIIEELTELFLDCLGDREKGTVRIFNDRYPVETDPSDPLVTIARKIGQKVLNLDLEPEGVNYYTDASVFVKSNRVPVILFGPGDERLAHQPNEYVEIDKLLASLKYYIALISELLT